MNPQNQPQNPPVDLSYQQDIHNKSPRDLMSEFNEWEGSQWDNEGNKSAPAKPAAKPDLPEDKTALETKPQPETPIPPPPPQQQAADSARTPPAIDEDKLTDKITERLMSKLTPETIQEKKTFEEKVQVEIEKAKAEGRELTYKEALVLTKEEAKQELREELRGDLKKEIMSDLNNEAEAAEKKRQTQADSDKRVKEESNKRMFSEWDRQLGFLQQNHDFPKVINKDDPEDPGRKAQEVLFQAMNNYAGQAQKAGRPVSLSLVEAFMSPEYKKLVEQPGRNAPVNGARKAVGPTPAESLSYQKDIHNRDIRDIMEEIHNSANA